MAKNDQNRHLRPDSFGQSSRIFQNKSDKSDESAHKTPRKVENIAKSGRIVTFEHFYALLPVLSLLARMTTLMPPGAQDLARSTPAEGKIPVIHPARKVSECRKVWFLMAGNSTFAQSRKSDKSGDLWCSSRARHGSTTIPGPSADIHFQVD